MSKFRIEIKWAIIFALATLLWMAFEKSMGWHDVLIEKHAIYTNFFAIIAIAVYVLALLDKRLRVILLHLNILQILLILWWIRGKWIKKLRRVILI